MANASGLLEQFDLIELKVFDIHGLKKGRLITRARVPGVLQYGLGIRNGLCYEGLKGPGNPHRIFKEDVNRASVRMVPILSTLKPGQKSVWGNRRIGSVLCEIRFPDDFSLDTTTPREATQLVLKRLQSEFGLHIKSSFEIEFGIRDPKTQKPLESDCQWASLAAISLHQDIFVDLIDDLQSIGVKIDTLMTERGVGQFEFTLDLTDGLEAADMLAEFRTACFLNLKSKGYDAELMACTDTTGCIHNGCHFNFSLWSSDGTNVFVDPDNPKELSEFGRHWLAGLVEHSPAMTAFCSPTVNCYRRMNTMYTPHFANWALEQRSVTFRLKIDPGKNVYIENRLPSTACNPHLVLACTVAAGMDGVRRKLPLPPPMEVARRLPSTLEEALDALERDTILAEVLGPEMVELFIYTKRKFDLEHFRALGDISDEEMFKKEKEYYDKSW